MKKLVGFITPSLPNNNFTIDLALSMHEAGMDILELGIPFSDPVADGSTIEKASQMALANGFKLDNLFDISAKLAPKIDTFWMGYMNPFFKYGVENFLLKGQEYGIKGSIIPDLPYEEAISYQKLFDTFNQTIIDFVAPTTPNQRIKMLTKNSSQFIYLVAYAGITGSGKSEDLTQTIKEIRANTTTPIYIGFGVDENTAKQKAKDVDGVIVGSTFVKELINQKISHNQKISNIVQKVKTIKEMINS